jgi:probable HAF family extracellular repeat protein
VNGTQINAINASGKMVGLFFDASSNINSFLLSNGTFTPIVDPAGVTTIVSAINDAGDIVGSFIDASGHQHSFLLHNGQFTTIDDPQAGPNGFTAITNFSNTGEIVGVFGDGSLLPDGIPQAHGFTDQNGVFTTIDDPDGSPGTTNVFGVNDLGQLVGAFTDASGVSFGFVATPEVVAAPAPGSLALLAAAGLTLAARRLRKWA